RLWLCFPVALAELDVLLLQKELRLDRSVSNEPCEERCVPAVWVVSAGRSGSTTLLEMLNQIPGYEIMGENQGMWGSLFDLAEQRKKMVKKYEASAEYLMYRQSEQRNMSQLRCAFQLRVLGEINPDSNAEVVGFKEIRWDFERGLGDLKLLMEVFPCSMALLSYRRNLKAEAQSRHESLGAFPESNLRRDNEAMLGLHRAMPKRTFLMAVEDFSVAFFNQMLDFLGKKDCRYTDVLHDNAGSSYTHDWFGTRSFDIIKCKGKE
ncbi:Uncharacterized protein SCF082_LOCUS39216, partial [Durusdinium trenchii]